MDEKKTIYQKHLEWAEKDDSPLEALEEPLHAHLNNSKLSRQQIDDIGMIYMVRLFDASLAGFKAGYEAALKEVCENKKNEDEEKE